jgi:hypothetical protein
MRNAGKMVNGDLFHHGLQSRNWDTVLCCEPHICERRANNRGTNSTYQQAICRRDLGNSRDQGFADLAGNDIVNLADMTYRVLAGGCSRLIGR